MYQTSSRQKTNRNETHSLILGKPPLFLLPEIDAILNEVDREIRLCPAPPTDNVFQPDSQTCVDLPVRQQKPVPNTKPFNQNLSITALAHDIRAPLANLQSLVQLIEPSEGSSDSLFPLMINQIDRLSEIANSLLQLAEASQEAQPLAQKVDLGKTLQRVQQQMAPELNAAKASFRSQLQIGEILYVPAWLESILRNLISNALKYAACERHPVIEIQSQALANGQVLLSIRDNGRGFAGGRIPEKLGKPFQRFHQGVAGSGLGLYLVKGMVEHNGGKLEVHSRENLWTRFDLTLVPY